MGEKRRDKGKRSALSASFVTGAVALIFLVIGYQTALFVKRAAEMRILGHRDHPDTVYVIDETLAREILKSELADGNAEGSERIERSDSFEKSGGQMMTGGGMVIIRRDSDHSEKVGKFLNSKAHKKTESFKFNPNTVSVSDLCRLGFSEKQAASIDNYRQKGGHFYRKTDFAKSFVVADSVYQRLEKYITIPKMDLNTADSAAFESLPGIGRYFASKMVSYRTELCGYSNKEQLMDIYNFDRQKYDSLSDLVEINSTTSKPYDLWTLPEEELRKHPYLRSYSAHSIVVFRNNNPKSRWTIDNLDAAGVLKDGMAEKLKRCLISPAE